MTGFLVQPLGPQKSLLTRLYQVDPRGSIPPFLVNKTKSRSGDLFLSLRRSVVDLPLEPEDPPAGFATISFRLFSLNLYW